MTRVLFALILSAGLLAAAPRPALAQTVSAPPSAEATQADPRQVNLDQASPEAGFAADMIRRLAAAYPQANFRASRKDPLVIEVSGVQWNNGQLYLHRVFAYCQTATPADCDAARQRMVAAVMSPPPAARSQNLRVIVRGEDYIAYAQAKAAKEQQPWFFVRKIGDDLYEALSLDGPNVIGLASAADLKAMNLKPEAAWALARRQTRAILPRFPEAGEYLADTVSFEGKEYVSAVLADTEYWRQLRDLIGPDLFVTVTTDQFVMASLLGPGPALDRFAEAVAEDCRNAERCISPHIYRFENGMWVIEK